VDLFDEIFGKARLRDERIATGAFRTFEHARQRVAR
jgi:hypothetical protein